MTMGGQLYYFRFGNGEDKKLPLEDSIGRAPEKENIYRLFASSLAKVASSWY